MDTINHMLVTRSIFLCIYVSWQVSRSSGKKLFSKTHQCLGFPNPVSGYFHHCAKTGDPAEQQTALSRSDTGANPQVAAQRTHCPVKPCTDWPRKIPGVCVEQMAAPFKTRHRVSGRGVIWRFSKSTQLSGPLLNTENMQSCLREPPFLSDAVSLGSSVLPQMDNENLLVSGNEMWKGHQKTAGNNTLHLRERFSQGVHLSFVIF